jgi:hypothetical protein
MLPVTLYRVHYSCIIAFKKVLVIEITFWNKLMFWRFYSLARSTLYLLWVVPYTGILKMFWRVFRRVVFYQVICWEKFLFRRKFIVKHFRRKWILRVCQQCYLAPQFPYDEFSPYGNGIRRSMLIHYGDNFSLFGAFKMHSKGTFPILKSKRKY